MERFINPFTDFRFHQIFGQEVHKKLLIDFLNQLLKDERRIDGHNLKIPHRCYTDRRDTGRMFNDKIRQVYLELL